MSKNVSSKSGAGARSRTAASTATGKAATEATVATDDAQLVDFEAALDQLEALVSAMEEGNLSLEESLEAFEKGVKLTRDCQSALQKAEQKVQILLDDAGNTEPLDFDDDEERD